MRYFLENCKTAILSIDIFYVYRMQRNCPRSFYLLLQSASLLPIAGKNLKNRPEHSPDIQWRGKIHSQIIFSKGDSAERILNNIEDVRV